MALRNIFDMSDPILRKKSRTVTEFNERIFQLLDDLNDTLTKIEGLGLAAPQVGILRRVAIVLIDEKDILELVNPEILEKEGEVGIDEACLSCPGLIGYVIRPERIVVKAQDRNGNEFTREFEGLNARAVCHEVDHLEGILFVDVAQSVHEDTEEYRAQQRKEEEEEEKAKQKEAKE